MTMYLCPRPGIDDVNITSLGVKRELPDVQAGFLEGRGTRDQIANIRWVIEKARRVPEKHLPLHY